MINNSGNLLKTQFKLNNLTRDKFLLGGYFILSTLFISFAFINWAYDDPFITYRYAQNIAEGIGFVYNPNERILSTTTPLFTILLSGFHLFIPDVHHLANFIGIISLGVGGYFLYDLSRSWKSPFVGWAGLFLYPTFPLVVSTLGSETPLYIALCIGGFAFYARKRYSVAAVLTALACLARPDGVLVPVILAIHYLLGKSNQIPWKSVLIFSGIVVSWVAFAWFYFGNPIPITLTVKQQQGAMEISQKFAEGFFTILQGYLNQQYILMMTLAIVGVFYALWKTKIWLLFLSWPFFYFLAYSILGVSRYFWYYAPLIPGFVLATGLGLKAIYKFLIKVGNNLLELPAFLKQLLPVLLLLFLLFTNISNLWKISTQSDSRYLIYKEIGEWLNSNTSPDKKIGLLEAGIIGYYSRRSIVDFAGLIQPRVAQEFGSDRTYEDAALWAVENYDLDYLVLHNGLFPVLEAEYVENNCIPVRNFVGEEYNYPLNIDILSCNN